jgi:hypothetical protein
MNRLGRLSLDERRNSDIGRGEGGYRQATTGTVVSEGVIMTYHNGMAVRVRRRAARHRRVA